MGPPNSNPSPDCNLIDYATIPIEIANILQSSLQSLYVKAIPTWFANYKRFSIHS